MLPPAPGGALRAEYIEYIECALMVMTRMDYVNSCTWAGTGCRRQNIALWSHQVLKLSYLRIVNAPQGDSPPNPKSIAQTA